MLLHQSFHSSLPLHFRQLKNGLSSIDNEVQDSLLSDPEEQAVLFVVSNLWHLSSLDFLQEIKILLVSSWILSNRSLSELQSLGPSVDLSLEIHGRDHDSLSGLGGVFTLFLELGNSSVLLFLNNVVEVAQVSIEGNESNPSQKLVPVALVHVFSQSVLFDLRFFRSDHEHFLLDIVGFILGVKVNEQGHFVALVLAILV